MNRVVSILMERDGMSYNEALAEVQECRDVLIAEGDEDVIMEMLGLEPDYVLDILEV